MRQSLKISLSFLLSLLIAFLFLYFGSSGVYNVIETNFFIPKIRTYYESQLEKITGEVENNIRNHILRFQAILNNSFISSAFLSDQSENKEDVKARDREFAVLKDTYPDFLYVRFLSPDGKKIHYSTSTNDMKVDSVNQRIYRNYDQVDADVPSTRILCEETVPHKFYIKGKSGEFIYSFPIIDAYKVYKGTALFYISKDTVTKQLLSLPELKLKPEIILISGKGILFNFPEKLSPSLQDEVLSVWEKNKDSGFFSETIFSTLENIKVKNILLTQKTGDAGFISILLPGEFFEIPPVYKIIILGLLFFTLFILIYLLLNLKQDPLLVISRRIRYMQIQFLKQFIDAEEEINWKKWHRDLLIQGAQIKSEIKKGIKPVSKDKEKAIDSLLDKSWENIISIIGRKAGQQKTSFPDIAQIEEIIIRALKSGNIVIPVGKTVIIDEKKQITDQKTGDAITGTQEPFEPIEKAGSNEQVDLVESLEQVDSVESVEELSEDASAHIGEELQSADKEAGEPEEELIEELESEIISEAETVEKTDDVSTAELTGAGESDELESIDSIESISGSGVDEEGELGQLENVDSAELIESIASVEKAGKFTSTVRITENVDIEELGSPEEEVSEPGIIEEAESHEQVDSVESIEEIESTVAEESELLDDVHIVEDAGLPKDIGLPENAVKNAADTAYDAETANEDINPLPPEPLEKLEELELAVNPEENTYFERGGKYYLLRKEMQQKGRKNGSAKRDQHSPLIFFEPLRTKEESDKTPDSLKLPEYHSDREEFNDLIAKKFILLYSLEEIHAMMSEPGDRIIIEDGVYRVNEEIIKSSFEPKDVKLKELVDSVKDGIHHRKNTGHTHAGAGLSGKISFSPSGGIQYDIRLKDIQDSDNLSVIRSFVEFSRSINAFVIGILALEGDEYSTDICAGLQEESYSLFKFTKDEVYTTEIFGKKNVCIINIPLRNVKSLQNKMNKLDLKYVNSLLLIPAVFKQNDAYFFLGFADPLQQPVKDLFTLMQFRYEPVHV